MRFSISPAFSGAMLSAHSLLGVIFGAAVYLMCVSGTLAVLTHEFELWETPGGPIVEQASPDLLARVSANAYALAKANRIAHDLYVNAPSPETPRLTVFAYGEDGRHLSWMADADGRLLPEVETPWTSFMRDHHYNLNLPAPFGAYLVGIIGTLLLASLISGLLAHRRVFRDAFRLRLGGSPRLSNADLHNRIGIWALPFHLIVALTGSLLGLAGLIIGLLAMVAYNGDQEKAIGTLLGPQATADGRSAPLPDLGAMMAQVERRAPGSDINMLRIEHIGTRGQLVAVGTSEAGHLTRQEGWSFGADGRFLAKLGYTDGTVGMRIYGMISPLHFGNYGGLALKLIYFLLGTGLCVVIATGGNVWLRRRREQGQPYPRTERLWAGLLWVQVPAFAIAGITALAGVAPPLPVYWAVLIGSLLFAGMVRTAPVTIARTCQWIGAGALVVLILIHLATRGTAFHGPLLIDLILAIVAGGLVFASHGLRIHDTAQIQNAVPAD